MQMKPGAHMYQQQRPVMQVHGMWQRARACWKSGYDWDVAPRPW